MGVLLLDNFHDVNGTALSAHVPDSGGTWVQAAAGLEIQSNALVQTMDNGRDHIDLAPNRTCRAQCNFDMNGADDSNYFALQLGDSGLTNYWVFRMYGDGRFFAELIQSGNLFYRGDTSQPFFDPAIPHQFVVGIGPGAFRLSIDGIPVVSAPRGLAQTLAIEECQLAMASLNAKPSPKLLKWFVYSP